MMKPEKKLSFFRAIGLTLIHAWKTSNALFVVLIISSVLMCSVQILEIIAMQSFFNRVAQLAGGSHGISHVYKAAWVLIFVWLGSLAVEIAEYLAQGYFWRLGNGYMQSLLHLKVGKMRLEEFEKTENLDAIKKATLANSTAPSASRTLIKFAFYYLPFFIFTSMYLFGIRPLLVFATVFIFTPVWISELYRTSAFYNFENDISNLRRKKDYFESCIVSREYGKETRTLGAFGFFFDLFLDSVKTFGAKLLDVEKKTAKLDIRLNVVNVLGYAGVIGLLLYYLAEGSISVALFATVYYSMEKIRGVLRSMIADVGETMQNISATSFLFEFLGQPAAEKKSGELSKAADIHLKDVSFAYPDTGTEAVSHITLDIRRGETIAVVGENGSGKTTLTKLIIGLYEPLSGSVTYGAEDISRYGAVSLYRSVSGVFQDFGKYKMTMGENITISDLASAKVLDPYLEKAGIVLDKCGEGPDTLLSREFGGTDLSGGEWQRIAIARGLYRSCDLIVLDEPTAAIDPIEESDIFRLFADTAKDKTAILVTHRLGSAKIADRIVVMDSGRIIEQGTHKELMVRKGLYYDMFMEQSKWYNR